MIIERNNFIFGLSERADGQMILNGFDEGMKNRRRYFEKVGLDGGRAVAAGLVHGNIVAAVGRSAAGKVIKDTDGLVTDEKGLCLTVTASDCLPLFFYDETRKAVGIAHAGWRGVVSAIALKTVEKMVEAFGSLPGDIKAYVGPHIRKCHFEVKQDVHNEFDRYPQAVSRENGRTFVDLEEIVRTQLIGAGLAAGHIESSPACTFCDKKYFSYRRDKPAQVISQVAFICLK